MTQIYRSAEGARLVERGYREYLERWPVPCQHIRVPTCQGETFVVACGPRDAPPLVLMHGSTANTATWMGDVEAWSKHFRVYAIDMIGEPGLSAPSRPPLASDAYERWLSDVFTGLNLTRFSIVGISLGGWLALDYVTRHPKRISKLVLLCPAGIGRQKYGALIMTVLLMPFGRWGKRTALRLMLGSAILDAPDAQDFGAYMMLVTRHFRPRMESPPVFDDDALRRLNMPVLAIVGDRDGLIESKETQRRLESIVPSATVRMLPDTGHLLLGQTETILEFLRA